MKILLILMITSVTSGLFASEVYTRKNINCVLSAEKHTLDQTETLSSSLILNYKAVFKKGPFGNKLVKLTLNSNIKSKALKKAFKKLDVSLTKKRLAHSTNQYSYGGCFPGGSHPTFNTNLYQFIKISLKKLKWKNIHNILSELSSSEEIPKAELFKKTRAKIKYKGINFYSTMIDGTSKEKCSYRYEKSKNRVGDQTRIGSKTKTVKFSLRKFPNLFGLTYKIMMRCQ